MTYDLRLNIAGIEFPWLPAAEKVDAAYLGESEEYVLIDGARGSQNGPVSGVRFTIDGSDCAVPTATRLALETLFRNRTAFTLIETYSNPEELRAWTGCLFPVSAPPKFTEIGGQVGTVKRGYHTFNLTIVGGPLT